MGQAAGHLKTTPIVEVAANAQLIMNNLLTHLSHTQSCFADKHGLIILQHC